MGDANTQRVARGPNFITAIFTIPVWRYSIRIIYMLWYSEHKHPGYWIITLPIPYIFFFFFFNCVWSIRKGSIVISKIFKLKIFFTIGISDLHKHAKSFLESSETTENVELDVGKLTKYSLQQTHQLVLTFASSSFTR